jgi:gas vesicle protein
MSEVLIGLSYLGTFLVGVVVGALALLTAALLMADKK